MLVRNEVFFNVVLALRAVLLWTPKTMTSQVTVRLSVMIRAVGTG